MHIYGSKHCNAKERTPFQLTGGDPQYFHRRTIWNRVCCCPSKLLLFRDSHVVLHYYIQQTRLALSSTNKWGAKDLHFDYRIFTNQLLALFKDLMNPWVKNLLDWWNECVTNNTNWRMI